MFFIDMHEPLLGKSHPATIYHFSATGGKESVSLYHFAATTSENPAKTYHLGGVCLPLYRNGLPVMEYATLLHGMNL